MNDWRFWLAEQRGTLLALGIFVVMFVIYTSNHPAGFTANVVQTAANKGVLLAFVAMAQTLVVLTAGIDLSVGMIFILTNCLASWLVVGTARRDGARRRRRACASGALCGALNGAIVIFGRLQPIVATIATGAVYFGIALLLRPFPGGAVNEDLADALTGRLFGVVPASLVRCWPSSCWSSGCRSAARCSAAPPMPPARRKLAAYMSGVPIQRAKFAGLYAGRPAGGDRRAVPHLLHLYGRGGLCERQRLYAVLDRRRGARRRVAVRRPGQRHRRDLRRARLPHHRRPALRLRFRSAVAAAVPGRRAAARGQPRRLRRCSGCATGWSGSDERHGDGPPDQPHAEVPAPRRSGRW